MSKTTVYHDIINKVKTVINIDGEFVNFTDKELVALNKLVQRKFILSNIRRQAREYGICNLSKKGYESAKVGSHIRCKQSEAAILHKYRMFVKNNKVFFFYEVE